MSSRVRCPNGEVSHAAQVGMDDAHRWCCGCGRGIHAGAAIPSLLSHGMRSRWTSARNRAGHRCGALPLEPFYRALREASAGRLETLTEVVDDADRSPILLLGPPDKGARSMLVVAGVHGNEVSGSLAATAALRLMHGEHTVSVHVIAPANPIGLAHAPRYNSQGCDINRDLAAFRTQEARAIRTAIDRLRPDLVVALHEGPQDGVFVIGTGITPQEYSQLWTSSRTLRK